MGCCTCPTRFPRDPKLVQQARVVQPTTKVTVQKAMAPKQATPRAGTRGRGTKVPLPWMLSQGRVHMTSSSRTTRRKTSSSTMEAITEPRQDESKCPLSYVCPLNRP